MIDPTQISTLAVSSILNEHLQERLHILLGDKPESIQSLLKELIAINKDILKETSTTDSPDIAEPILLGTYVESYTVPVWKRNHLCALLPTMTLGYWIPGMAALTRTISNAGWYQLDLPAGTLLSATAQTSIYLKWCDNAVGLSL